MKKIICFLFGHSWSISWQTFFGSDKKINIKANCDRCGEEICGFEAEYYLRHYKNIYYEL